MPAGRERGSGASGSSTVNRAPPPSASPASTVPPCEVATALTIASPSPVPDSRGEVGGAVAADEALEDLVADPRRQAGAVVGDLEHGVAVAASTEIRTSESGGV